jgi:ABC-2 type transport system permease protein
MSTVAERGRQRTAPRGTLFALVSHTFTMQLKAVIIWGAALGLYSTAMVASFTAIEGSAAQLNRLMEAYPKGMLEAFGITDLGNSANYLHSPFFGLAPLALSFFPILALANAIAGAEERGTIDVLLGNPLLRWQLVVGNFLATALSLLGICAIVGLSSSGPRPRSQT